MKKKSLREQFLSFDAQLASLTPPVPPATQWWRDGIGQWLDRYERDHILELWACAGRGSAKSTLLYKLALFFALFGDFHVPPGEVHYAMILSVLKSEAEKGLSIIDKWLELMGIPHAKHDDVVELTGTGRGIRIASASVSGASGWRSFFIGLDERSKWPTSGIEEVDADEIEVSAMSMSATHEYAPKVVVGSAFGKFGSFYECVMTGSDGTREVLGPAATWVVAPHVTEASCRRKEPRNETRFKREYACEFQAGAGASLDADDVAAAIRDIPPESLAASAPIILTDQSAGRGDSWTWCVAQWFTEANQSDGYIWCDLVERGGKRMAVRQPDILSSDVLIHRRCEVSRDLETHAFERDPDYVEGALGMRLVISCMAGMHGKFGTRIGSGVVLDKLAELARQTGVRRIFGDAYGQYTLTESMGRRGLSFTGITWGNENKVASVAHLRSWLRDGTLIIVPGDEAEALRRECLIFQERLNPSGYTTYGARSGGHDDRVSLLLLASLLDAMGAFTGAGGPGSPMHRPNVRTEIGPTATPQQIADSMPWGGQLIRSMLIGLLDNGPAVCSLNA